MRKKLMLLAVLAVIVGVMLYLRGCGKTEDNKTPDTVPPSAQETTPQTGEEGAVLGTITKNETDGGIIITVPAENGTQQSYQFTDVDSESWYADAVNYVVSNGLMQGSEDGPVFEPDYGMQRLQFAIVVYRLTGGTETEREYPFNDVESGSWFSKYVNWVVGEKLMTGKADGNFDPLGFLSCEQALIVFYRMAGEPAVKGTLDAYPYAPKISANGLDAVTWAWNSGLITENECVWYPTQTVSRAQVALLLMRYSAMMG